MTREEKFKLNFDDLRIEYREAITQPASFNARFIRQSCCPGHYAHILGRIEPCQERFVFENKIVDNAIPDYYIPACEHGFKEAMEEGKLAGYPVRGIKVILEGGSYHEVDSREWSFRLAARIGFAEAFMNALPILLEPIMRLQVQVSAAFIEQVREDLLWRRGVILSSKIMMDEAIFEVELPVAQMVGYEEDLKAICLGGGSFAKEFCDYRPVPPQIQQEMIEYWVKYNNV